MLRYTVRRILLIIPTLIGVAFIVYGIMFLSPSDPGTVILGATAEPEQIAALNHELGYDKPFLVQFFNYIFKVFTRFDFGISWTDQQPVIDQILMRIPATLKLALLSMVFASCAGISIGIISAVKQYSITDIVITVIALFFAAIPTFWLGLMMIKIFALDMRVLPTNGLDTWKGYVLPTIVMSFSGCATLLRITRSSMLETLRQDYVKTAKAKGAGSKRVILIHALRNALLPVITVMGTNFGRQLGGVVIIESVFALPGLGTYILNGIRSQNVPAVCSSVIILSAMFCIVMLVVDLLYAVVDPRIKARYAK